MIGFGCFVTGWLTAVVMVAGVSIVGGLIAARFIVNGRGKKNAKS